jgi:hypothetical protein
MVESRRKHGSFDRRYPSLSVPATPTSVQEIEGGLEWTAFLDRFYPGSRRHNVEALAAYGAYRAVHEQPDDRRDGQAPAVAAAA